MAEAVIVDARGLSCPQPVVETKKAIKKTPYGEIHVLVDTVSNPNVRRLDGALKPANIGVGYCIAC